MNKYYGLFLILIFIFPSIVLSQKEDPTLIDLKVQAMYRAAKLTWKTKESLKSAAAVLILRADTFEEGPYREVETVSLTPGKNTYEYVDKSMGAEAKYYYKLIIRETNESFGPLPVRPYFSPPATRWQPIPKRLDDYILGMHFRSLER